MIISSLTNINTSFSFFLLSLVSVLSSVGIDPLLVLPKGTFGNGTQKQLHLAVVLVRRSGCAGCYEGLSIADAGTERAERFRKVLLRFACEHSQETRRSSQHVSIYGTA